MLISEENDGADLNFYVKRRVVPEGDNYIIPVKKFDAVVQYATNRGGALWSLQC